MENRELTSLGDLPVSDLMHYGVLGMKWGVRRYQNKDGSLTAAGKKQQQKKVDKENKHSEYAAKRILNEKLNVEEHNMKRYNRKLNKISQKNDKYETKIDKAHDSGKFDKRDKYLDKYFENFDKLEDYTIKLESSTQFRDLYKRKISEIESGKIKAGRDYVAHYTEMYDGVSYYKNAKLEFISDKGRA